MFLMKNRYQDKEGEDEGTGGADSSWRDSLSEDLVGSPALKDIADVGSLAKQFVDQQRMIGNSIRIPGEDAGDEDRQKFYDTLSSKVPGLMPSPNSEDEEAMAGLYKSLGRPDEATGYETPTVEGVNIDDSRLEAIRNIAHENGLSNKQFNGVMKKMLEADAQQIASFNTEIQEGHIALKQEWGESYDPRIKAVLNTAKNGGAPPEIVNALESGEMRADSVKWLYNLMDNGSEQTNFASQDGLVNDTPGEAEAQINDIMNNPEHAYWHPDNPGNAAAIKKVVGLQRKITNAAA